MRFSKCVVPAQAEREAGRRTARPQGQYASDCRHAGQDCHTQASLLQVLRPSAGRHRIQEDPQDPDHGHQVRHGDNRGAVLRESLRVRCREQLRRPNCRIKYGDNIRALVTYLNVVQCIPFKRIAELLSDRRAPSCQ